MRTLTKAAGFLALALSGCGSADVLAIQAPVIPPSLLAPCTAPVALPARDLTAAEVEVLWGRDRSALRACGYRHDSLAASVG